MGITNHQINRIYRRITGEKAQFSKPFAKTKSVDYYHFFPISLRLGMILFDERSSSAAAKELGRLSGDGSFLDPSESLKGVFSLFAFSSSLRLSSRRASMRPLSSPSLTMPSVILKRSMYAPRRAAFDEEIGFWGIITFHARYDWNPMTTRCSSEDRESGGYLLRSKIRSAIEFHQLYLYHSGIHHLRPSGETYEIPTYEELFEESGSKHH